MNINSADWGWQWWPGLLPQRASYIIYWGRQWWWQQLWWPGLPPQRACPALCLVFVFFFVFVFVFVIVVYINIDAGNYDDLASLLKESAQLFVLSLSLLFVILDLWFSDQQRSRFSRLNKLLSLSLSFSLSLSLSLSLTSILRAEKIMMTWPPSSKSLPSSLSCSPTTHWPPTSAMKHFVFASYLVNTIDVRPDEKQLLQWKHCAFVPHIWWWWFCFCLISGEYQ